MSTEHRGKHAYDPDIEARGLPSFFKDVDLLIGRSWVAIRCFDCGFAQRLTQTLTMPTPRLIVVARKRGWMVTNRGVGSCPVCCGSDGLGRGQRKVLSAIQQVVSNEREQPSLGHNHREKLMSINTISPAEKEAMAKLPVKKQREVFALLEQYFDVERGIYRGHYSDEKIGKELDIPWAAVKVVRIEGFGELRVPTELSALRGDIDGLRALVTEHKRTETETLGHVSKQLDELTQRLGKLEAHYR